jgi:hypothetical protein
MVPGTDGPEVYASWPSGVIGVAIQETLGSRFSMKLPSGRVLLRNAGHG